MKHIIRKLYSDFEKEEKWLNEMSAKGMALIDYSWCKYVFTETQNNEYTYRIELLENLPSHEKSIEYINFLEESGVEYVAKYIRWVYFRKKSSEGTFDIYSDIESKIKHYKRINVFWSTFMGIEFMAGLSNIVIGIVNLNIGNRLGDFNMVNIIMGALLVLFGLAFLRLGSSIRKKIKNFQQEKMIRE
ncbi:DUF2812 domain-containing protein [Clostridium estertheticum]|uniref:DUF2812 domain-containing protein n=1 Tax=Clostridium estertheticum TaxID=238834 RepID=UPI001C7E0D35|nr:DUF2812 domain-containing protein [Clostridium estertheticum]MBX4263913.1 DUF2812 domain-containing protein [Clostridium estertheticum]WLC87030.1 DUF2812 domain-containing protein [Clostridium estertheticum]